MRIRESTDRHGDEARQGNGLPAHGAAALAAKLEPRRAATPTDPDILPALPLDRHRIQREPRLHSEHAARALLPREAMADGDADRLAAGADNEASTAACCLTVCHERAPTAHNRANVRARFFIEA
jgi:hypothetical protein